MTAGGYGSMRPSEADRQNVHAILQQAHNEGRLSWENFDARATALQNAQSYDQMAALTADLPSRIPMSHPQVYAGMPGAVRPTNGLAIAALICGIGQIFFWFVAAVCAIIFGHLARRQIRQTGEGGDGLALAGLILGYVGLALSIIGLIAFLAVVVWATKTIPNVQLSPGP
jgi:Domain of unknown function (DUF4190)/Domain of unknown function (DUF1707)